MMTDKEKVSKLQQAIWKLDQADQLMQEALGASDITEDTHNRIQDIIHDLESDIDTIMAVYGVS